MIIAADRQAGAGDHALLPRPVEVGADAGAADRGRDAREHHAAEPHRHRGSYRIVPLDARIQHRLLRCWTRLRTGRRTKPARARRRGHQRDHAPAWRPFPARCCSRLSPARSQGRAVVCVLEALRQGRPRGSRLAGRYARHEQRACRRATSTRTWPRTLLALRGVLARVPQRPEAFVSREVVEACTGDYYELPPVAGRTYYGYVDAASGSGPDSFAVAISHREGQQVIIDLRARASAAVLAFAGDRRVHAVAQELPHLQGRRRPLRRRLSAGGVPARRHPLRSRDAGEERRLPHRAADAQFSGASRCRKRDRLFNQLVSLERHVARGGHDVIDHPRDQHDDLANAAMGAAVLAGSFGGYKLERSPAPAATTTMPDYEARDQAYRNEFAQRIFQLSGGRCWPR